MNRADKLSLAKSLSFDSSKPKIKKLTSAEKWELNRKSNKKVKTSRKESSYIRDYRDFHILQIKERREELLKNQTHSENNIRLVLKKLQINYVPQKQFHPYSTKIPYCFVDFYLPEFNMCLEIDGGYHRNRKVAKKDRTKEKALIKDFKVTILRITNNEADTILPDTFYKTIVDCRKDQVNFSGSYFDK